jgi:hypothetical protein
VAWTAPLTAVSSAALTAAGWNATVRDNLAETATAKAATPGGYFVATGANAIAQRLPQMASVLVTETTTSDSYGDLTTFGPSVTVETGVAALVIIHAQVSTTTGSGSARMSYLTSGETDINPADNRSVGWFGETAQGPTASTAILHGAGAGLDQNPGTHTYTAKYRVTSGTGQFQHRRIMVLPF